VFGNDAPEQHVRVGRTYAWGLTSNGLGAAAGGLGTAWSALNITSTVLTGGDYVRSAPEVVRAG
jgi:hypothetical protein